MQFFEDAPNLPNELLEAHQEDRLVFICGSGISKNAGLELFEGLTNQVLNDLGGTLDQEEKKALKRKEFDKVFSLLERGHRFGSIQVRESVKRKLTHDDNANLEVHRSILTLAKSKKEVLKLITTNFDTVFETCDPNATVYNAPLLPIPKPNKWSGIVHLHGSIKDDLLNLVLSSNDFGVAYLTERWGSRFITDLFSNYTVLFIGYSLNDSVMKYLMDALAAERKRNRSIGKAFALVPSANGNENRINSEWKAKNINPIIYSTKENDHSVLYKTLSIWAKSWSGGLESKHNIVSKIGRTNPDTIPNDEVQRLIWAISSDKTGSTARAFSKLKKEAPVEWLMIFHKEGILEIQDENSESRSKLFDWRYTGYNYPALSIVQVGLIDWIISHLDKIKLIDWVIDNGFVLHPKLRWHIQYHLNRTNLPNGLQKFWSILAYQVTTKQITDYYHDPEFFRQEYTPIFKQNILSLFDSILIPRKAFRFDLFHEGTKEEITFEHLYEVANFEVKSRFERFLGCIIELKKRNDWDTILLDILPDLIQKLKSILDLYSIIDRANENYDTISSSLSSVENQDFKKVHKFGTRFIALVIEGLSKRIVNSIDTYYLGYQFFSFEYPTFRRLAYYITRVQLNTFKDELFAKITLAPNKWLWNFYLRIEQSKTLPLLWDTITKNERNQVEQLILKGPPKKIFRTDISDADYIEAKETDIWELLSFINFHSEKKLSHKGLATLSSLTKKLKLKYKGSGEEHFGNSHSNYSTAKWTGEKLASEDFQKLEITEIVNLLSETDNNYEGKINSFRNLASKKPKKASRVLRKFIKEKSFSNHVFNAFFYGFDRSARPYEYVFELIIGLSNLQIDEVLFSVTDFLRESAKKITLKNSSKYFEAWDLVLERASIYSEYESSSFDIYNEAYSHPVGKLTYAIFNFLSQQQYEENSCLPKTIKNKLITLLNLQSQALKYAITIFTSRLGLLQHIDSEFTKKHLYNLFNLDSKFPLYAWEGFLWHPYVSPEIFNNIKKDYYSALNEKEEFTTDARNTLPLIIPIVNVTMPDLMDNEFSRKSMDKLDSEDLSRIIRWIIQKLHESENDATDLWNNIIQPWLSNTWPKKISVRTNKLSLELTELMLIDIQIFKSAFDTLYQFLTEIEFVSSVYSDLTSKNIVNKYPLESLLLANKITPDHPNGTLSLKSLLESIAESDKNLKSRNEFTRLNEISLTQE